MKSARENKWSADAEAALMGFVVPVESNEHARYILGYNLFTLHDMLNIDPEEVDDRADEIMENVNRFNSNNTPVSHISFNTTAFGTCVTFVRDEEMKSLTSRNGVLAWVENLEYPNCSELGYVFFAKKNGKISRVA